MSADGDVLGTYGAVTALSRGALTAREDETAVPFRQAASVLSALTSREISELEKKKKPNHHWKCSSKQNGGGSLGVMPSSIARSQRPAPERAVSLLIGIACTTFLA